MAGRRPHSRALSVWANGRRMATWRLPARGSAELVYDDAWIRSEEARPLSVSLPISLDGAPLKGDAVLNYFDNLLPDSELIRRRVEQRFQTDSLDAFDLLQAIGRDCVGAVQLLAEDDAPVGVESIFREIQRRHFNAMSLKCGFGESAEPIVQRIIERTPAVIDEVAAQLPKDFPPRVAERIFDGLRKSVAALEAMPAH